MHAVGSVDTPLQEQLAQKGGARLVSVPMMSMSMSAVVQKRTVRTCAEMKLETKRWLMGDAPFQWPGPA